MTLAEARAFIGARVTYQSQAGADQNFAPLEGTITGITADQVLVRYDGDQRPLPTDPGDLTLIAGDGS